MISVKESYTNTFWDRMESRAEETVSAIKTGRMPDVIRFAVHVTSRCNMSCRYCREDKYGPVMDKALFYDICKRAGKKGIVHITGGEPLVVPWLENAIWDMRDVTTFALNTNLLRMPSMRTLETVFRVKTSLDDHIAERWEETVGGNFFNLVVDHIYRASEAMPRCSVSFTATHQNSHRFGDFIAFYQDRFPNIYSLSASFYKGNDTKLILQASDIDALFKSAEQLDTISKQLFMDTHTTRGNYFPENLTRPCYLSMTELLIDEHGREFWCSHLYRDKVTPPGKPGDDPNCVTGCNARFAEFNRYIHNAIEESH